MVEIGKEHYATYLPGFTTSANFTALGEELLAKARDTFGQDGVKKRNTGDLEIVNQRVNVGVQRFRHQVAGDDAYVDVEDMNTIYADYSLIDVSNGTYGIPRDNDERQAYMRILISRLQRLNDPMANKKYGLAFWEDLADEHLLAWGDSTDMKSDKTVYSVAAHLAYYKLRALITRFRKRIDSDISMFPGETLKDVLRKMGFIAENN